MAIFQKNRAPDFGIYLQSWFLNLEIGAFFGWLF
jgi:hypothetical protein